MFFKRFLLVVLIAFGTNLNSQINDASNEFSYALKLYEQGFFDLSAQQFIKFYNTYPTSDKLDEAQFYAGMSLFKLQQFAKARIEFQSMALEHPSSPKAGEAWFKAGECYVSLENFAEAAKAFETIKILYPQNPFADHGLLLSGENYKKAGDLSKAKSVLLNLLERYPDSQYSFKANLELAIVLDQAGESSLAEFYINRVITNSKNDSERAQAYFIKGEIFLKKGHLVGAKEALKQISVNYKKSKYTDQANFYLGQIAMQEKSYPEAISNYNTISENAGINKNELKMALGDAYFMDTKFGLAEQEYQQSNFKNDSLELIRSLKIALAQKNQNLHNKALNTLKNILDNHKDSKLALFNNVLFRYLDWKLQSTLTQTDIGYLLAKFRTEKNEDVKLKLLNYIIKFYSDKKQWNDLIREVTPYTDLPVQSIYNDDFIYYLALAHYNREDYENVAFYLEKLISQYPASSFYNDANKLYQQVRDYYYIDQKRAISAMAAILGAMSTNNEAELQFELGKIYYQDLKDFKNARSSFEKAVGSSEKKGDVYLYLGKTFLKLAEYPGESKQTEKIFLEKAAQSFTKSVENIQTCSAPDEASWLMVQSTIAVDTISVSKQKNYIETLINKYPQSQLKEKWIETLAHNLSFEQRYQEEARKYFQQLVDMYPQSKKYSDYLYGYAKLVVESDKEKSLSLFRKLALDFENDPNTPDALQQLAKYYENNNQFKEAALLYNNFLQNFYYTDEAKQIEYKLGEINIKAGQYTEAINVLQEEADHPFLNDVVLSDAFLSANVKIKLVYLGMAYARLNESEKAQDYLQQFLTLSANPDFRDIALIELAQIYEQNRNNALAIESYKNVGNSDPALYIRARYKLASLLFENQKFDESENFYNELSNLVTEEALKEEVDGKLIICKIKNGKISQAEQLIKQYKRKFSDAYDYFAQFTIEFGDYFRRQKNYDRAIRYFKTVKSNYKKSSQVDDAEYFIALTYITLNRNEDAFDILTKFKANYPKSDRYPFVVNTLGSLYYRVEKYDEAIAAFKSAINLSKDDELTRLAMSNLIKTYQLTGFWDAAQGLARQYLDKYTQAADRIDKKMVIAQAFINLNQFQNAVEYLKSMKLEADSEKEPEIQFYIGEAYLKAGQYEEAIAEFVKIPLLSKKTELQWEASALYYSGQAYEKMGRINDAIRMYQEIINRPGIDMILKRDAERRINQIKG